MIVRILTERSEQYAVLERLYDSAVEFCCSSVEELITDPDQAGDDILVADPALTELEIVTGSIMKRRLLAGKPFIICGPDRIKGLVRELKAAGLETRESEKREESLMMAGDSEQLKDTFHRDRTKKKPSLRLRIGVLELIDGAGADFLTLLLAEELAAECFADENLVTVFAPDDPYYYRALSLGKKFLSESFLEITETMVGDSEVPGNERAVVNVFEGISWAVGSGIVQEKWNMDLGGKLKILDQIEGNYCLCPFRFSGIGTEMDLLKEYLDVLLVVVDPLPSALLSGIERLELVQASGIPVIYVVNHMNEAVKKELVLEFLETEDAVFVPAADPAAVCEAEYAGENPYRIDVIRKQTMLPVCRIIERLKRIGSEPESFLFR